MRETQATMDAIAARYTSTNTPGVMHGLVVAPALGNPALLHIAAGAGYSPNGELVVVSAEQNNVALADSTPLVVNFVLAIYTEIYGDPQAHEDLGTTLPTSAIGSYRIAVLTQTQWNVLPNSDTNLNNNARDRAVILAIVTVNGGVLNITGPLAYPTIHNVTQPTSISGVHIDAVSNNTSVGTGVLTYNILNNVRILQWTAPGDTIGVASTNITSNRTIVLYSNNVAYSLVVTVNLYALPVGQPVISNSIIISDIYSQSVPRLTGVDDRHRHMLGHGIPSINNPHATALIDMDVDIGGVIQQHQQEMHANGIFDPYGIGSRDPTLRTCLRSTVYSDIGIDDVVRVAVLDTSADASNVAYVNGVRIINLPMQTVTFTDVAANYIELYGVYLEPNGSVRQQLRAVLNPLPGSGEVAPTPDVFGGNVQPIDISDYDTTFDTEQDVGLTYRETLGVPEMAITGGLYPGNPFWVSLSGISNINQTIKLPYTRSATDVAPVVGGYNYIEVWINPAWVGTGNPGDTVPLHIYGRPSTETTFLLSYVVSQGRPHQMFGADTVMLGWGLYGTLSVNRVNNIRDRRIFGTLAGIDINDATIGKEKIKDLSQPQVFNAIGYVPYNITNPAEFAVRTGGPGAEPTVTSHVMYADNAGSSNTAAWSTITGRPLGLANMSGDYTFQSPMVFSMYSTTFQSTTMFEGNQINYSDVKFTSAWSTARGIIWDYGQVYPPPKISMDPTGTWFGFNRNVDITGDLRVSAGLNMIYSDITLNVANTQTVKNVKDPLVDYDAANKRYVDTQIATTVDTYGVAAFAYYWTGVTYSYVPYATTKINSLTKINTGSDRALIFELPVHPSGKRVTIVSVVANAMTDGGGGGNTLQTLFGPTALGKNLPNPHSWASGATDPIGQMVTDRRFGVVGWYSSTDGLQQPCQPTGLIYYILTDTAPVW